MRISLIGPSDIEYHFLELLKISKDKFIKELLIISKTLAESGSEIVFLPDNGICYEIALKYKEFGGSRVIATLPKNDKVFGIGHMSIDKDLINEVIDTDNWYKQDMALCLLGDAVLMLGNSLGSLSELMNSFYLYKLVNGRKKGVDVSLEKIHPQARAGKNIPFSAIIYKPFMREKLNFEIEEYIKKTGGRLIYANNAAELKLMINNLKTTNKT